MGRHAMGLWVLLIVLNCQFNRIHAAGKLLSQPPPSAPPVQGLDGRGYSPTDSRANPRSDFRSDSRSDCAPDRQGYRSGGGGVVYSNNQNCYSNRSVQQCCSNLIQKYEFRKEILLDYDKDVAVAENACIQSFCQAMDQTRLPLDTNSEFLENCLQGMSYVYTGSDIVFLTQLHRTILNSGSSMQSYAAGYSSQTSGIRTPATETLIQLYKTKNTLLSGLIYNIPQPDNRVISRDDFVYPPSGLPADQRTLTKLFTYKADYAFWHREISMQEPMYSLKAHDVYDLLWCPETFYYYELYITRMGQTNQCPFIKVKWVILAYCHAQFPGKVLISEDAFLKLMEGVCLSKNIGGSSEKFERELQTFILAFLEIKECATAMAEYLKKAPYTDYFQNLHHDQTSTNPVTSYPTEPRWTFWRVAKFYKVTCDGDVTCLSNWVSIAHNSVLLNVDLAYIKEDFETSGRCRTTVAALSNILNGVFNLQLKCEFKNKNDLFHLLYLSARPFKTDYDYVSRNFGDLVDNLANYEADACQQFVQYVAQTFTSYKRECSVRYRNSGNCPSKANQAMENVSQYARKNKPRTSGSRFF